MGVPPWDSVRTRIETLCAGQLSSKELRLAVLARLRPVVRYDAYAWLLTDPVTRVGTSPLADIPGLAWADPPELIRRRYLVGDRWAAFQVPDVAGVATSGYDDRFGRWGWLDLWRIDQAFSAPELTFLASLVPAIIAGLRAAQARTYAEVPDIDVPRTAVLILDPDLQPRDRTSAAARALLQLNPPDADIPVVPAAAYNVAAALLAAEAGVRTGAAWSRVHLGGSRWVTLSAARMNERGDIAVTIEPSTPALRREVFALAHALTARERQVLDELATGADSQAIAGSLVISEHTVNDHIKAILAKAGVPSRARLLSRIAG
jgi:DNA-binding CsgD family transcriptional regulator